MMGGMSWSFPASAISKVILDKITDVEMEFTTAVTFKTKSGREVRYLRDDVLDKIREEIRNIDVGISSYYNDRPWVFKDEVLQIIDKYREGEE